MPVPQISIEQLVAAKTPTEINALADQLEILADAKAAAIQKAAAANAAAAKGAAAKGAMGAAGKGVAVKGVAAPGMAAKGMGAGTGMGVAKATPATCYGAGTIWSGKGMALGIGLGLGSWGPLVLAAGAGAASYALYKRFKNRVI